MPNMSDKSILLHSLYNSIYLGELLFYQQQAYNQFCIPYNK